LQYGALDRVTELVEAGADVNQPDSETVTLLHWAAINNRKDIVKYLIGKGAVVDAIGGELASTPLHWATRSVLRRISISFDKSSDINVVSNMKIICK